MGAMPMTANMDQCRAVVGKIKCKERCCRLRSMRKVDDVQNAVNQRQSERNQRVYGAGHNAVQDGRH